MSAEEKITRDIRALEASEHTEADLLLDCPRCPPPKGSVARDVATQQKRKQSSSQSNDAKIVPFVI